MRKLTYSFIALLAALTFAGCGGVEHRQHRNEQVRLERAWPAQGIRAVEVTEPNGNITLEAGAGDQITLVANASGDLQRKNGAENEGLFTTEIVDGTLRIGRHDNDDFNFNFFWDGDEMEVEYILRVPAAINVELTTVNGRIVSRGVEGETEVQAVNGTIDVESPGLQTLRATTVNGRVEARFTRDFHGAHLKTVNGTIETYLPGNASFNVDLSQVNGDFDAAFPLTIHSNPGSRRVSGEVNGGEHALKIVTVNGDVELRPLKN